MRFEFLFPGKTKERFCAAGIEEFHGRLGHFISTEIRIIKEKALAAELAALGPGADKSKLASLRKTTCLVLLDSRGRLLSSEELAELVTQWEMGGEKHITFFVGGPTGIPPRLLEMADLVLSLSPMTFTHDMARLLLIEQLYRAFAIKAGLPYHK